MKKVIYHQDYNVAGPNLKSGDNRKNFANLYNGPSMPQEIIHQMTCVDGSTLAGVEVWCSAGHKTKTSMGPATYFPPVLTLVAVGRPFNAEGNTLSSQKVYVIHQVDCTKKDWRQQRKDMVVKAANLKADSDTEGVELEWVHEESIRREHEKEEAHDRQVAAMTAAVLGEDKVQRAMAEIILANSVIAEAVQRNVAQLAPFPEDVQAKLRQEVSAKVYRDPSWNKA